jgi:pimeloyl-ACP methyl ester carboxylesterase
VHDELTPTITGAGAPILLIHGTAASLWGALPARLAHHGTVLVYDRRGFGGAPGPAGTSLTTHADDAASLLERHADGPAVVVGWSIGGVIALELAVRRPELVRALVLVEPPLHAKRHPRPRMVAAIAGAQLLRRLRGEPAGARHFLNWALRSTRGPSGLARLSTEDRAAALANAGAIVRELEQGTGEHLASAELAHVGVPVELLIGALSDGAFSAAGRRIAEHVPGTNLTQVAGSAHTPQLDAPDAVVAAVQRARDRAAGVVSRSRGTFRGPGPAGPPEDRVSPRTAG